MTWIQSSFPNPFFFPRSTYQSVYFQSILQWKVSGRGSFKKTRGRLDETLQTMGLYQRRHVQLFPQRQSELVWCAVTTLIAFNVPCYGKTNKELTMTRRWNQITHCWRHFLCCCSHGCESRCCWWCCSQITIIFAIYRTRTTLRYSENAFHYAKTYRNHIWPEYHYLLYPHYRDRSNIILPYIFSPKLLSLLDMCSIRLNVNYSIAASSPITGPIKPNRFLFF